MSGFRVILFSGMDPAEITLLISRIHRETNGCRVVGVLREHRAKKAMKARIARLFRNFREGTFRSYVLARIGEQIISTFAQFSHAILRVVHAAPGASVHMQFSRQPLSVFCKENGISLLDTYNVHSDDALDFVRGLSPDLGVVYGTGILKPSLFLIPRLGSINVHKRKLPDYRGGGPIGLWEMLDGEKEIGVTVHQVTAALDAGAVLASSVIPIEPYDTLTSLGLKADVVGNDLLIRVISAYSNGSQAPLPQPAGGKLFRTPAPHHLRQLQKKIASDRQQFRPALSRSRWKLLVRSTLLLPYVAVRNWIRRYRGTFPLVVLYHHLVSDRPHRMGISTEHFSKQIDFLSKHYRLVSLAEGLALLREGRITVPTVALTFDDGYADNYINLRAVSDSWALPCALFICSGHVTSGRPFGHDVNEGVLDFRPLTWDEVEDFNPARIEIGSHTRSHFDCASEHPGELHDEIELAKDELNEHLHRESRYFSFPYGQLRNISRSAMEMASSCHESVFSAYGGMNYPGCDTSHIRRICHPASLWELELAIQGILEFTVQAPDGTAVKPDLAVPGIWETDPRHEQSSLHT